MFGSEQKNLGLRVMCIGIGLLFMKHGWGKITGGEMVWIGIGNAMANLGVVFMPSYWGLAAGIAEFVGGLTFVTGFFSRLGALAIASVMSVAILMHYNNGDAFTAIAHPISILSVCIGIMIAGGGSFLGDE